MKRPLRSLINLAAGGSMMIGQMANAAEIAPAALDHLPKAQVVILGELHDNPTHHANQARAVAALRPKAVVWEMLSAEAAAQVPADRRDLAAVAAATGWGQSGWPDFALYHPIFLAAGPARHYGAELPRDLARQAVTKAADGAAATMPMAAIFGLDQPLPAAEQAAREAEQQQAHCDALPETMLPGMVAAQRLRDGYLAAAVLLALEQTGGPVAVITGSGHARRDWGLPAVLAKAAPAVTVLSIGQFEADAGADPGADSDAGLGAAAPYDLWLITDPVPRPDPCAAFR